MELSSITPAVIVTWVLLLAGFVANYTKVGAKVDKHDKIIYAPNGEINVLTAATFLQRQQTCQKAMNMERAHLVEKVEEMERHVNTLAASVDLKDKIALNRILELRECTILLSSYMKNVCNLPGGHPGHG